MWITNLREGRRYLVGSGGPHDRYPGDDTAGFEKMLRQFMPRWMAFDMLLVGERFLTDGMLPKVGDVERLTTLLGRPLRTYRDFITEITAAA